MSTSYTSLLGFALPATGELSGTWGDTVNNSITTLLDSAIAGTTTIVLDQDVTLSSNDGTADTSRQAIILWTAGGSATRTITAPGQSKIYTVINASSGTQSIILNALATTGVTIAKGESALVAWNGSDFIKISNTAGPGTFTNLTVTGNTSLGDADTDTITQAASYVTGTQLKSAKTATNTLSLAAYDVDGTAYTNLITLTASNTPTLALTSTGVGTINNMSIGATTASTGAFTTVGATGAITSTQSAADTSAIAVVASAATRTKVFGATGSTTAGMYGLLTNTGGSMLFGVENSGGGNIVTGSAAYSAYFGTNTNTPVSITVNSAQVGVFDTNGNLGLGVTPVASVYTPSRNLFVGQASNLIGRTTINFTSLNTNVYEAPTTSAATFINASTAAAQYQQYLGAHTWRVSTNTPTANTSIVWNDAMTLDASGNLLVGATTAYAKLKVGLTSSATTPIVNVGSFGAGGVVSLGSVANNNEQVYLGTGDTNGGGIAAGIGFMREASGWNSALSFYTNNVTSGPNGVSAIQEKMRLDSSGNLGIGATTIYAKLQVAGAANGTVLKVSSTDQASGMLSLGDGGSTTNNVGVYRGQPAALSNGNWLNLSGYDGIAFTTGNFALGSQTERARIDSSGNLLVGQTSAGARVDVLSGSNQTAFSGYVNVASSTSTPALYLAKYDNDTTTSQVYVRFAYNQNTFTGGQINGNGANQAAFGSWSDRRLKENIVDLPPQLDKIMALRPVEFDYLQSIGGGHQIGFIAQELQTIYEDSVGDDGSEEKHLSITGWSKTEARLVKAIQEQQALITQLTARITALEGA